MAKRKSWLDASWNTCRRAARRVPCGHEGERVKPSFAFDAAQHEYVELPSGRILPHITGLLERAGWVDKQWYTDECRTRGTAVHTLTADYDIGAIEDPASVVSAYSGWLHAHVAAMRLIGAKRFTHIEVPLVSATYQYGGRPDRGLEMYAALSVLEIKSGAYDRAHEVQTALQAILLADEWHIPAEAIQRYGLYLQRNGKFKLEQFIKRQDFDEAHRIIREYAL